MAWREKSLSSSYGPRKRSRGVPRFFPRCPGLNKSWGLWDKSKGRGKDSSKTWLKLPTNRGQVSHMGLIWRVKAMWHFTDFSAIRKIMLMTRPPPPYLYHRHHPSLPPLSSHLPSACCFVLNDSMCETPTAKLRCIPFYFSSLRVKTSSVFPYPGSPCYTLMLTQNVVRLRSEIICPSSP